MPRTHPRNTRCATATTVLLPPREIGRLGIQERVAGTQDWGGGRWTLGEK